MTKRILIVVLIFFGLSILASCGIDDDEDDGVTYACSYEKRSSQTCNHYDWGAWTSGCYQFNSGDYYISPQEVCNNVTKNGLHCASGCCIDSQYQNEVLRQGICP